MGTTPRPASESVSHSRLLELLEYDQFTGEFRWKVSRSRIAKAGMIAGTITGTPKKNNGNPISICLDHKRYLAHQLAWFYVHGEWAGCELDHKNGNRHCNAITNLRKVDRIGNAQNIRSPKGKNAKNRLLGVYRGKRGRWFSTIMSNGKTTYLGTFETEQMAHEAYVAAKRVLHPTCTI